MNRQPERDRYAESLGGHITKSEHYQHIIDQDVPQTLRKLLSLRSFWIRCLDHETRGSCNKNNTRETLWSMIQPSLEISINSSSENQWFRLTYGHVISTIMIAQLRSSNRTVAKFPAVSKKNDHMRRTGKIKVRCTNKYTLRERD